MLEFIRSRLRSLLCTLEGIRYVFTTQLNMKLEVLFVIAVCSFASTFHLSISHWMTLIFALSVVLVAEFFNTAIEVMCDLISLKYDINIKIIKDVAAGAVLIAVLAAFGIILIILYNSKA